MPVIDGGSQLSGEAALLKNLAWIGVIGALALPGPAAAAKIDFGPAAPSATPEGVTLQAPIRARRGLSNDAQAALHPRLDTSQPKDGDFVYADARGMTMYTTDKDVEPSKATCVDECAKAWPAALAPRGARPLGDWSPMDRADGTKQWSYKGKPLYTFARDLKIGDANGNGAQSGTWHTVSFQPTRGLLLPVGFSVEVIRRLNGQTLVDNHGMTMYYFDGKAGRSDAEDCKLSSCAARWTPVAASELARPVGDFSAVAGADSTRQWAFRGQPLFTFGGDLANGDAHGDGIDGKWHAAVMVRYVMPSGAKIAYDEVRGALLTTANGLTLYRQGVSDHSQSNRSIPYARPGSPALGRAIGVSEGCSAKCLEDWRPYKAPEGAVASGYWEVATRADDGSKQWIYKSHALYTYKGDKRPGDFNGNDIYQLPSFDETKPTDAAWVVGVQQGSVLYWAFMAP